MKRIISLLLIVITLSSLLAGCEWNGEFDWNKIFNWGESEPKWKLPEGIIETTVEKDGAQLTIAHSENFTQDDIDFVVMKHEVNNNASPMLSIMSYSLGTILSYAQDGSPLYLMHFENPYIIIAYLKPNQPDLVPDEKGKVYFDATRYVWCKFYDSKSIPKKIGDATLTSNSYLLYDCTVVRDIANGIEYNRECKYYLKYIDESSYNRTTTDMLMWFGSNNAITTGKKFISEYSAETTRYEVYTDDNGVEYLKIQGDTRAYDTDGNLYVVEDYVRKELWPYEQEYYDILSPYFTYFSHSEYEDKNDGTIFRYVYIEIDDFINAFFDK